MARSTRKSDAELAFLLSQVGFQSAALFAERLAPLELTPPDVGILKIVSEAEGLSQQDLGVKLSMFPSRLVAFLDHTWNSRWSSTAGYSSVSIDNSDLQLPAAFRKGQYASANLIWTPVTNVMMGGEFQWAHRQNFSDGFKVSDYRMQFSFKYSFSAKVIGG